MFDRYEVFMALAIATEGKRRKEDAWGPLGRFGWKFSSGSWGDNPLARVISEVTMQQAKWPPFEAGIFGSDFAVFEAALAEYAKMIRQRNWL